MIDVMKEEAQTLSSVHVDEATIQVLDEKVTKNQYMWVLMSGKWEEKQMILYHYHKNRNHAFAKEILSTSHEYVHNDAYAAYEKVENITNAFCLAHARRYLLEALEVNERYTTLKKLSKEKQKEYIEDHPGFKHLYEIYTMIQKIFSLEKEYRRQEYTPEEIYQYRQEEQKGLLGELFICIRKSKDDYGVKSKAGKAIHYLYTHFDYLTNYMLDGRLECSIIE